MERAISCGLDPGREKFGLAIAEGGGLIFSAIIPVARADEAIALFASGRWSGLTPWGQELSLSPAELDGVGALGRGCVVRLGDGTGSDIFQGKLREAGLRYEVTDETGTTLAGRARYWRLHPPSGLWCLVPLSLRVPPRPIDDMAAWAIAERPRASSF